MKKLIQIIIPMIVVLAFSACENYVQSVDPLIDQVEDDRLNDPTQLNFLIKGVKQRFASVWGGQSNASLMGLSLLGGGLADELYYDAAAPGSSYPSYQEVDLAENIQRNNPSVESIFFGLGELRYFADDLVRRALTINAGDALENALFTGYLYGGIARYLYATYFGLYQDEGGGVINAGPFIPADQMYDDAIDKLKEALNHTDFDYSDNLVIISKEMAERVVHSLITRCYLFKEDNANAATHAAMGMIDGDPPFNALYNANYTNIWYVFAYQRNQFLVANRFADYITADPNEANRIELQRIETSNGAWWQQARYLSQDAPINFMTWQENELMLAELELSSDNTSALARVNAVRASHGIDPLAALDSNTLIEERDKELFLTAVRLPDQRRFDIWHLAPTTWKYLPITQSEINGNPNINIGN